MQRYTGAEEIANSVTHGIGVALSIAALGVFIAQAGLLTESSNAVGFIVYASTLLMLYAASTFYHAAKPVRIKQFLRLMDHSAIFLLIAGTYTPFALVALKGAWGWTIFGLIWSLAAAGIVITLFFMDRLKNLCVILYVGMGWLGAVFIHQLIEVLPSAGLIWLLAGGLAYTGGVVFYLKKNMPFSHAIWHLFVLAGSVFHFICIFRYILPMEMG